MWILAVYFFLYFSIYEPSSWFSVRTGFFLLIILTVPIPVSIFIPYGKISVCITDQNITFTQPGPFNLIMPQTKKVVLSNPVNINYNKRINVISFKLNSEMNIIPLEGLKSPKKDELLHSLKLSIQNKSNIKYSELDDEKEENL
jgi:hypothetical protein